MILVLKDLAATMMTTSAPTRANCNVNGML
jgi:hypothetical protein